MVFLKATYVDCCSKIFYACIARVSQRCFYETSLQMLEKEQWPPNNSQNLNAMQTCLGSNAQSYLETFI